MTDLPTSLTYNIQPGVLAQVLGIAQCSGDDRLELSVWSNNDASPSSLVPNPKTNGWGSGFMSQASGSTALTYGSTKQVRSLKFQVRGSTTKKDYDLQLKETESRFAGILNVTTITAKYQTWFTATIILVEFRSKPYVQSGKGSITTASEPRYTKMSFDPSTDPVNGPDYYLDTRCRLEFTMPKIYVPTTLGNDLEYAAANPHTMVISIPAYPDTAGTDKVDLRSFDATYYVKDMSPYNDAALCGPRIWYNYAGFAIDIPDPNLPTSGVMAIALAATNGAQNVCTGSAAFPFAPATVTMLGCQSYYDGAKPKGLGLYMNFAAKIEGVDTRPYGDIPLVNCVAYTGLTDTGS